MPARKTAARMALPLLASLAMAVGCSADVDPDGGPAAPTPDLTQTPQTSPVPEAPQGPPREGPSLEVLSVQGPPYSYTISAQDSADGLCVELRDDTDGLTVGCGFEVPERRDVGFLVHQGVSGAARQDVVLGQVSGAVDQVRLEFADGAPVQVPVTPVPGLDTFVFSGPVAADRVLVAVVALDAGQELDRREV